MRYTITRSELYTFYLTTNTTQAGLPTGDFGPRGQAITAVCPGADHLSKHTAQTIMADLLGLPMSWGTLAHLEQAPVQALTALVLDARVYGHAHPIASLDDTGPRVSQPCA